MSIEEEYAWWERYDCDDCYNSAGREPHGDPDGIIYVWHEDDCPGLDKRLRRARYLTARRWILGMLVAVLAAKTIYQIEVWTRQ